MRVRWTEGAGSDLEDIFEFIAQDSPRYARSTITAIKTTAHSAALHPRSGRIVTEIGNPDIREYFYGRYRVMYRITGAEIEVLSVFHSSRLFRRLKS